MTDKELFEELKADKKAWAAYKRIKAGKARKNDLRLVMPYIPEFRKSMEKAENAIAEGRTLTLEEVMRRADENQD